MSKTFYENLLEKFKKANKGRKIKLASQAGFGSAETYKEFLESKISEENYKKVIHIVDILDCSGSMAGGKIRNAVEGINNGILELKKSTENIDYTYTLCDFSSHDDIQFRYLANSISEVKSINVRDRGMTALNDAIGSTLTKIETKRLPEDKVLINIYTDGGENDSRLYTINAISKLISAVKEKGVTITFIGTETDTASAIKNYGIDNSNTLSYDGSSEGLFKTMSATQSARASYSSKVSKGQDVKTGFYKNITKK